MLETVQFLYAHGGELTGAIIGVIWSAAAAYVVATWLRTTSEPMQITFPDEVTVRLQHHHFALTDENLPDEDDITPPSDPAPSGQAEG